MEKGSVGKTGSREAIKVHRKGWRTRLGKQAAIERSQVVRT